MICLDVQSYSLVMAHIIFWVFTLAFVVQLLFEGFRHGLDQWFS